MGSTGGEAGGGGDGGHCSPIFVALSRMTASAAANMSPGLPEGTQQYSVHHRQSDGERQRTYSASRGCTKFGSDGAQDDAGSLQTMTPTATAPCGRAVDSSLRRSNGSCRLIRADDPPTGLRGSGGAAYRSYTAAKDAPASAAIAKTPSSCSGWASASGWHTATATQP